MAGSPGSRPTVIVDGDGAAAVAAADAIEGRTAIWVGAPDDPELAEFEAEITRRTDAPIDPAGMDAPIDPAGMDAPIDPAGTDAPIDPAGTDAP
ncbi:MAG: hypothetical protein NVSMB12_05720 [Acidimicrobiales bacterium]